MNNTLLMSRFERRANMTSDLESLFNRDWTTVDAIRQRFTLDQLQHQESGSVRFMHIVDARDIPMIQRGQHLGFTLKPADAIRIAGELVGEEPLSQLHASASGRADDTPLPCLLFRGEL
jgi:hypothetical protein